MLSTAEADRLVVAGSHRKFAGRMAVLAAAIFVVSCAFTTWVDPQLTSLKPYGARTYPLGYAVCFFGLPLFAGIYLLLTRIRGIALKPLAVGLFIISLDGSVRLLNFRPPFPNWLNFSGSLAAAAFVVVAAIVHYAEESDILVIDDVSIAAAARLEWVKQAIVFWQTISIGATGIFFAALIPWLSYVTKAIPDNITEKQQQGLMQCLHSANTWLFAVCFVLGPLYESIAKTVYLRRALLRIKESRLHMPDQETGLRR